MATTATDLNLHDLTVPPKLSPAGRRACEVIHEHLTKHEATYTGGCRTFYSPAEWRERGEEYGRDAVLIVVYDGGNVRPYFSLDAAYDLDCEVFEATGKPSRRCYSTTEDMGDALRAAGFEVEECTSWYSAVYARTP
jgi:hypothetical protein